MGLFEKWFGQPPVEQKPKPKKKLPKSRLELSKFERPEAPAEEEGSESLREKLDKLSKMEAEKPKRREKAKVLKMPGEEGDLDLRDRAEQGQEKPPR